MLLQDQDASLSGIKMYAVVEKNTDTVQFMWVGKNESDSDHDRDRWYLVEMTKDNGLAYAGGKYKNGIFYQSGEEV